MLRSLDVLKGYTLLATDGDIGRTKDFLFDDRHWFVRFLVAGTATWLPGKKVLVSPIFLEEPIEETEQVPVALSREMIENSPELNEATLRSVDEVLGYPIRGTDGELGHVEDFIVDTSAWKIRWFVVDTGNWLPGRKVLVSPAWASEIRWPDRQVHLDLTIEAIQNSPEFDPSAPINSDYERRLFDYYGRPQQPGLAS